MAELTAAVEAQREADHRAHRASLRRRPSPAVIHIGDHTAAVRFYGVTPAPDDVPAVHVELWMPGDPGATVLPAIFACEDTPDRPTIEGMPTG